MSPCFFVFSELNPCYWTELNELMLQLNIDVCLYKESLANSKIKKNTLNYAYSQSLYYDRSNIAQW